MESNIKLTIDNLDGISAILTNKYKFHITFIEPAGYILLKLLSSQVSFSHTATNEVNSYLRTILSNPYRENTSYVPYCNFNTSTNIDSIAQQIVSKINMPNIGPTDLQDFKDYVNYAILEIMQNVIDHSQTKCNGHIYAQVYSQKKSVQVAIGDCGIGYLKSLKSWYTLNDEIEAIQKAIEPGVSGSPTIGPYGVRKNMGMGLYAVSKIIEHSHGKLLIISNNGLYYYNPPNTPILRKIQNNIFHGVIVAFEIFEEKLEYEFDHFKRLELWALNKEDECLFED